MWKGWIKNMGERNNDRGMKGIKERRKAEKNDDRTEK
jgi:hypothetical protein